MSNYMNQKQSWEEDFDRYYAGTLFNHDGESQFAKVKDFIKQAIQTREREISEEVGKKKRARPTPIECVHHPESAAWDEVCKIHNDALDIAISIINNKSL